MNKKTKKQLIIGGLITGAALLLLNNKSNAANTATTDVTLPLAPQLPSPTPSVYPIVYNTFHPQAKLLQAALGVPQDGIIGPVTLAAWQKYDGAITKYFQIPSPVALQKTIDAITRAKQTSTGNAVTVPVNDVVTVAETVQPPSYNYGTDNGPIEYTRADYGEVITGTGVSDPKKCLL